MKKYTKSEESFILYTIVKLILHDTHVYLSLYVEGNLQTFF